MDKCRGLEEFRDASFVRGFSDFGQALFQPCIAFLAAAFCAHSLLVDASTDPIGGYVKAVTLSLLLVVWWNGPRWR